MISMIYKLQEPSLSSQVFVYETAPASFTAEQGKVRSGVGAVSHRSAQLFCRAGSSQTGAEAQLGVSPQDGFLSPL